MSDKQTPDRKRASPSAPRRVEKVASPGEKVRRS